MRPRESATRVARCPVVGRFARLSAVHENLGSRLFMRTSGHLGGLRWDIGRIDRIIRPIVRWDGPPKSFVS